MPDPKPVPSPVVAFLLELANDPEKLARFRRDPERALARRTKIPAADRKLLARGDFASLRLAAGQEAVFLLVLMSPAPEPPAQPPPKPKPAPKPRPPRRRGSQA